MFAQHDMRYLIEPFVIRGHRIQDRHAPRRAGDPVQQGAEGFEALPARTEEALAQGVVEPGQLGGIRRHPYVQRRCRAHPGTGLRTHAKAPHTAGQTGRAGLPPQTFGAIEHKPVRDDIGHDSLRRDHPPDAPRGRGSGRILRHFDIVDAQARVMCAVQDDRAIPSRPAARKRAQSRRRRDPIAFQTGQRHDIVQPAASIHDQQRPHALTCGIGLGIHSRGAAIGQQGEPVALMVMRGDFRQDADGLVGRGGARRAMATNAPHAVGNTVAAYRRDKPVERVRELRRPRPQCRGDALDIEGTQPAPRLRGRSGQAAPDTVRQRGQAASEAAQPMAGLPAGDPDAPCRDGSVWRGRGSACPRDSACS